MVGWHHRLNRHEFEQIPENGEGQGSLASAVHGVANSQTRLTQLSRNSINVMNDVFWAVAKRSYHMPEVRGGN